jgi:uncharacterized lipoprotein YmbA
MTARRCLALAACAWLAACAADPPTRIYLLAAPAGGNEPLRAAGSAAGAPVQLQTVLVPDYLDTTDILLRAGPHEVIASRTGRWAERLSQGITHALQAALASRLPGRGLTLSPPADPFAAQLLVTVDALDAWPDGHCVLRAHWTVLQTPAGAAGRIGQGVFTSPPSLSAGTPVDIAIVAAMADAVDRLALRIASDLGGGRGV